MPFLGQMFRLSVALHNHGFDRTAGVVKVINFVINGADLSYKAKIGRVLFPHPSGVVIAEGSVVEDGCKVLSGVVLGVTETKGRGGVPIVRGNCIIGTGAKILGNVEIGEESIIGGNAVVVEDVPPRCVVVGIPGRVVRSGVRNA